MDRERAERHLRLVCDRALRRASDYLDATADGPDDTGFVTVAPLASRPSPHVVIRRPSSG
jgi:hypothetical protein